MTGMITFILMISIIIGFHESAHFLFMKLWGVKVIRFSIGFGPVLVRKKIADTEYQIAAIPLGGYVLPLSRDLPKEYEQYRELNHPEKYFETKPAWQRMVIYLVGPLSNLLFAFVLYFILSAFIGIPNQTTTLAEVAKNFPAEQAGLKAGDIVEMIDGQKIENWEDAKTHIQKSGGAQIRIRISRNNKKMELTATPKEYETAEGKIFMIGVSPAVQYRTVDPFTALKESVKDTAGAVVAFAGFFKQLFSGKAKRNSMGGVIMIYQVTAESAKYGWVAIIGLMVMINLNLFVFNILPIPLLDGGQIYPALFEMITGIKPSKRFSLIWQNIGIALLGSLFLLATYNDLERLWPKILAVFSK